MSPTLETSDRVGVPARPPAWRGRRGRLRLPRVRRRYAIFLVASLAFGLAGFQRMGLAAIANTLIAQFGLNASQLGSLGSSFFYIYAFMQFPIGIIIDRWGVRATMTALLAAATLGGFIFALAPTFGWMIAGRALVGFGVSIIFIGGLKLLAAWFPTKDLAVWNGLFLALSDAAVLGTGRPLVEISTRIGWSGAFLVIAGLTGITTILFWLIVRDEPASLVEREGTLTSRPPTVSRAELLTVLRSPVVWLMGIGAFFCTGTQTTFQSTWAGPYLTDVYALAPAVMGNLIMLIPLGRSVGNLCQGWIADRVLRSRATSVMVGLGVFAASWLPLTLWPAGFSVTGLSALYFGSFGFSWVTLLLIFPIMRSRFSDRLAGTASGAVNMLCVMGVAVTQQLFGGLINRFTPQAGHYPLESYRLMFTVGLFMAMIGWILTSISAWIASRKPTP